MIEKLSRQELLELAQRSSPGRSMSDQVLVEELVAEILHLRANASATVESGSITDPSGGKLASKLAYEPRPFPAWRLRS